MHAVDDMPGNHLPEPADALSPERSFFLLSDDRKSRDLLLFVGGAPGILLRGDYGIRCICLQQPVYG